MKSFEKTGDVVTTIYEERKNSSIAMAVTRGLAMAKLLGVSEAQGFMENEGVSPEIICRALAENSRRSSDWH